MIRFYRDNWYKITGIVFCVLAFIMGFWGQDLRPLQVILIYNFMALLAHQFEEYVLPGGAPVVLNAAFYGEKKDYDRYPGNKQSCMLVNTLAYPFYLLSIFNQDIVWLGLATMIFGFMQVIGHGITMNIRGKTWYNPGMATAICLHLPIGIYYLQYIHHYNLVSGYDYLYAFLTFVLSVLVIIILPVQLLKDRKTPYPMSEEEIARFNMVAKYQSNGVLPK